MRAQRGTRVVDVRDRARLGTALGPSHDGLIAIRWDDGFAETVPTTELRGVPDLGLAGVYPTKDPRVGRLIVAPVHGRVVSATPGGVYLIVRRESDGILTTLRVDEVKWAGTNEALHGFAGPYDWGGKGGLPGFIDRTYQKNAKQQEAERAEQEQEAQLDPETRATLQQRRAEQERAAAEEAATIRRNEALTHEEWLAALNRIPRSPDAFPRDEQGRMDVREGSQWNHALRLALQAKARGLKGLGSQRVNRTQRVDLQDYSAHKQAEKEAITKRVLHLWHYDHDLTRKAIAQRCGISENAVQLIVKGVPR